jgi:hypothetical protein
MAGVRRTFLNKVLFLKKINLFNRNLSACLVRRTLSIQLKNKPLLKVQEEVHTIPSSHLPDINNILLFIFAEFGTVLAFSEMLIATRLPKHQRVGPSASLDKSEYLIGRVISHKI